MNVKWRIARLLSPASQRTLHAVYNAIYWQMKGMVMRVHGQGWPAGHYHSPIPNVRDLMRRRERVFVADALGIPGVALNEPGQLALGRELARFFSEFDWQERPTDGNLYYIGNPLLTGCDALVLYAMLRRFAPTRVIEVGSGFSSALMVDTDQRFLGGKTQFTFIDPYPARLESLLEDRRRPTHAIIPRPVQEVPLEKFEALGPGDFLFIDSSHVSKAGSDLNFLLLEVLPRLQVGVIVHFHDVLWPFEYPERWVLRLRWAWNEAYMLRAFMQFNRDFEIFFFNGLMTRRHPEIFNSRRTLLREHADSSIWLRRTEGS